MNDLRCPGQARGVPDHDSRHVSARIEVPWTDRPGAPVRVVVVHRCEQYGCPLRLVDREEEARDADAVLRKVLEPRGMLGCSHTLGRPTYLKGCLPACRAWDAPDRGGTAGATYEHVPGCPYSLAGLANGHLEAARQAFMRAEAVPDMASLRDAPRPAAGSTTSDPDDFLRRAATTRPPAEDRRPYDG